MSVLLIRPMTPATSMSGLVSVQYPINIGYLASFLKKHGINCYLKDFEVEPYNTLELLDFIESADITLVGFSCMTPHITHAAFVAAEIKKRFSGLPIVVGGVHPSALPVQTLQEFSQFDLLVVGEGEYPLLEIYRAITDKTSFSGIRSVVYRLGDEILINSRREPIDRLDQLPFPDRHLVDMTKYRNSHVSRGVSRRFTRIAEIVTSRGCPYECIFCSSKIVHSRKVRFRSASNVIEEMEYLIENFGVTHFSFLDDTFTLRLDILTEVCNFMKDRGATFDCLTRVDGVDENKLALMVRSGCKKISYGIESGSERVLRLIKKEITIGQIRRAFAISRMAGVPLIEATFLMGSHPDETLEEVKMTERLIFSLQTDLMGIFIAIPYPGTELNKILKERGFLKRENWDQYAILLSGKPDWASGNPDYDALCRRQKMIFRKYFLNPAYVLRTFCKIRTPRELLYLVFSAIKMFKSRLIR